MIGKGSRRWLLLLLVTLLTSQCTLVGCLSDSIFDFVSFDHANEWQEVYKETCGGHRIDRYREPRLNEKENDLKAMIGGRSPVQINTSAVVRAPKNDTLQIYNNAGIRNGYSVSYGFQRNKECIHGQDSDCVTSPEFGRVRAVVINADRFPKGQNLNYIKDHFLIEDPEKFATILNGGSRFERKFYEAVFLGGYGERIKDGFVRSSHEIDGKIYPMEIYMYFIDETVPSMSLTTILVVLVEESEKDNPYIKPIISTVKDKLYDEERRFIHNNEFLRRREKLYHHLGSSLIYDLPMNEKRRENKQKQRKVLMRHIEAAAKYEEMSSFWYDIYEKMQGLDSRIRLLDEDFESAGITANLAAEKVQLFLAAWNTKDNEWQYNYKELHSLALGAFAATEEKVIKRFPNPDDRCTSAYLFNLVENEAILETMPDQTKVPWVWPDNFKENKPHFEEYMKLFVDVCQFAVDYVQWHDRNQNQSRKDKRTLKQKYADIRDYQDLLKERDSLDLRVYEHFFVDNSSKGHLNEQNRGLGQPVFKDEGTARKFVTNMLHIVEIELTLVTFLKLKKESLDYFEFLAKLETYDDDAHLRAVVEHLKYGEKNIKHRRDILHDAYLANFLPSQQKRRGYQEFGNMGMSEQEIQEVKKMSPVKVPVEQSFQISWLMPQYGGYYYYSGSSPVPPCFRAQNVIVFKKPITMSKDQIKILTKVPTSFNRDDDITFNAPFLHDLFYTVDLRKDRNTPFRHEEVVVPVYDMPRNQLFLGHDGVHKNAVEEYEKREKRRKAKSGSSNWIIHGGQSKKLILIFTILNSMTTFHLVNSSV